MQIRITWIYIMKNQKKYGLFELILVGKGLDRTGSGRHKISWIRNLETWFSSINTRAVESSK